MIPGVSESGAGTEGGVAMRDRKTGESIRPFGYELDTAGVPIRRPVIRVPGRDYGSDPMGDGTFRMVPSGDVVDLAERNRRLRGKK